MYFDFYIVTYHQFFWTVEYKTDQTTTQALFLCNCDFLFIFFDYFAGLTSPEKAQYGNGGGGPAAESGESFCGWLGELADMVGCVVKRWLCSSACSAHAARDSYTDGLCCNSPLF
jgi:hypothetical protein